MLQQSIASCLPLALASRKSTCGPAACGHAPRDPRPTADDSALCARVLSGEVSAHRLESLASSPEIAVRIRRHYVEDREGRTGLLDGLPHEGDGARALYDSALGVCCENVVGFVPIPVGVAGPLLVDGRELRVPLATVEGALVASVSRGAKAISLSPGGSTTSLLSPARAGMTRAPLFELPSAAEAARVSFWAESPEGLAALGAAFTAAAGPFASLRGVDATQCGHLLWLRLRAGTGDAMGMNMVSQGSAAVVRELRTRFPAVRCVAVSGNLCSDKKPAALNAIRGRGRGVVAEVRIPAAVVADVLKASPRDMARTCSLKNHLGSALAGAGPGGLNAHAANIVAALFIATGQDAAQVVGSSNCVTMMEETEDGGLLASCTMPSLEVGTVGGGTRLPAQRSCLRLLGVEGAGEPAGANGEALARAACSAVLAGELSLMASLTKGENDLIDAHLRLNRKN